MKPLLVGESNPYQSDPRLAQRYALYPEPERCAGWNLCYRVMQLEEDEYLRRFDRVNLCDGKWGMKEARAKAARLEYERHAEDHPIIVLCGSKVCAAFETSFMPFCFERRTPNSSLGQGPIYNYVILPHPSGLSRAWNEPGAHERARAVLREAGVL